MLTRSLSFWKLAMYTRPVKGFRNVEVRNQFKPGFSECIGLWYPFPYVMANFLWRDTSKNTLWECNPHGPCLLRTDPNSQGLRMSLPYLQEPLQYGSEHIAWSFGCKSLNQSLHGFCGFVGSYGPCAVYSHSPLPITSPPALY